jgi:hypothetical protein
MNSTTSTSTIKAIVRKPGLNGSRAKLTKKHEFLRLCDQFGFVGFSFTRIGLKYSSSGEPKKDPIGLQKEYQKATKENFRERIKDDHKAFGFITGERSGITIVDCDTIDVYNRIITDFPELANTLTAKTRKGRHMYFKYDKRVRNSQESFTTYPSVDILSDGGVIYAQPTQYEWFGATVGYEFINENAKMMTIPDGLINDLKYRADQHGPHHRGPHHRDGQKESEKKTSIQRGSIKMMTATEAYDPQLADHIKELIERLPEEHLEPMSEWLKYGAIIHYELGDNIDAKVLFLEMSKRVRKYRSTVRMADIEEYWKTFSTNKERCATIATIVADVNKYEAAQASSTDCLFLDSPETDAVNDNDDTNLARYFVACYGDVFMQAFACGGPQLYYWNGETWETHEIAQQIMLQKLQTEFYYRLITQLRGGVNGRCKTELALSRQLQQRSNYKAVYESVLTFLPLRKDVVMDMGREQHDNLHFKNGVLMLKRVRIGVHGLAVFADAFRPRVKEDYITRTLDWDFEMAVDREKLIKVSDIFAQIQPDPVQSRFQKAWLGYCLTGHTGEQRLKFNIGYSAANGKTTEALIQAACFGLYCAELPKNIFAENNTKGHKFLLELIQSPVRYAYIEEMDRNKLDEEMMKTWTDGKEKKVEVLFSTYYKAHAQAKFTSGSNKDPNAKGDQGFLRRGLLQYYNSRFVKKDCNPLKHVYPKIDKLEAYFSGDQGMKRAYLEMLLPHVVDYYTNGLFIPDSAEKNLADTLECYDRLRTTLFDLYEKGDEFDRISKDELMDALKANYEHRVKWEDILPDLRGLGINYEKDLRITYNGQSRRGAIIGLKKLPAS